MQNKYIILKSPVKIGDYERVVSYSGSLTKGEEQLLVTRDLKFFLTDGKGGYLEFKSINSGITLDEVNQKFKDLDNKMSDKISDLDDKSSNDIKTLKDAVDALSLKFSGYVTTEDFEDLKTKIESNTTLATHDNREVLDKFSVDKDDNPLFNGKKIVADFDTSGIEAEITDLKNRSVIGSSLDYGLFTRNSDFVVNANGAMIPMNSTNGSNMTLNSNGRILLKAGKKYKIAFGARTINLTSGLDFGIYDYTNSKGLTLVSDSHSNISVNASHPGRSYYVPTTDCEIGMYITWYSSTNPVTLPSYECYIEVQEINRQVIIDPCEDGKNINFEYGEFQLSSHMTTGIVNGALINFDKVNNGNLSISDNKVLLKAGKTYEIEASLYCVCNTSNSGYIYFGLYNEIDSIFLKYAEGVSTTYGAGYVSNPTFKTIFNPTKDTYISIKIESTGYIDIIDSNISYFIVKEIAQPYYFNYYKDSLQTTTLFNGAADAKAIDYTLSDSIKNYEKIIVYAACNIDGAIREKTTSIINVSDIKNGSIYEFIVGFSINDSHYYFVELAFPKDRVFNIANNGCAGWSNPIIYKIEGIGYTYENPYQDVITTIDEFTVTDSTIDSDINSVWNEVGI
jgi:hypothetical protein